MKKLNKTQIPGDLVHCNMFTRTTSGIRLVPPPRGAKFSGSDVMIDDITPAIIISHYDFSDIVGDKDLLFLVTIQSVGWDFADRWVEV